MENGEERINDFEELRKIVEYKDPTPAVTTPVEIHPDDQRELDERLESIARAQAFAVGSLNDVVLR